MSSIRYLLKKIISFFKTKEDVANLIIEKELHSSKVIIGENFTYRKYCILRIFRKGILEIGDRVFINSFSTINCFEQIKIGNDTIIGENVKIYDHNHSYDNKNHLKIDILF